MPPCVRVTPNPGLAGALRVVSVIGRTARKRPRGEYMRGRLPHWVWRSGLGLGLMAVVVAAATPAGAQSLTSVSAVKNAGNTADDFSDGLVTSYQNKTTVTVVSSSTTVFRVRYAEIVAADVGVTGSDRTQSQASDY